MTERPSFSKFAVGHERCRCFSSASSTSATGSLEKANRSDGSLLTGTAKEKPWPSTLRRAASSSLSLLYRRPTSLSPQECLPALSVRFWMLLLFHNRQAVLAKAQPTVVIDQLSAAKPVGNSLLLIMLPSDQVPVLFGREYSKKLEKLFLFSDLPLWI